MSYIILPIKVIRMEDIIERFETEVKRGVMQVAIMCLLDRERYGYDIIKSLKDDGLNIEEGTLYPILRRLEDDKILASHWETGGSRPRKYYQITEYGKELRVKLLGSLRSMTMAVEKIYAQNNGVA